LSNSFEQFIKNPIQLITHLFLHTSLFHLLMNLSGIGLASVYERKVGGKRFLAVLSVSLIFSIPSVFFYLDNVAIAGISGGVFGLAAAYFTDEKDLTLKEWLSAIAIFVFFVILLTIASIIEEKSKGYNNGGFGQVDHIGHALGAIAAIFYCRMFPRKR